MKIKYLSTRKANHLAILYVCFSSLLLLSNLAGAKLITLFGVDVQAVIFFYPLTFVIADIVTEVYGFWRCRFMVFTGFLFSLIFLAGVELIIHLPSADSWEHQKEFELVFAQSPRIFISSTIAYFIGELTNSFILVYLKKVTNGKYFGPRAIGSTFVGATLDSMLFCHFVFYGILPENHILDMITLDVSSKIGCEFLLLPLSYYFIRRLTREEDTFELELSSRSSEVQVPAS